MRSMLNVRKLWAESYSGSARVGVRIASALALALVVCGCGGTNTTGSEPPSAQSVPTLVQWASGTNTFPSTGHTGTTGATSYTIRLPDPAQGGNCIVFAWFGASTPATITVSDDKSNAYTRQATETDTTNSAMVQIWTAGSITGGTRSVTVSFSTFDKFVSAVVAEFYNTSCVADGNSGNFGKGATIQAGSFTPTTSGDLLFQYAFNDSDYNVSSFTAGSQSNITWQLMSADVSQGNTSSLDTQFENAAAVQYGVYNSTAAINPQITQGGGTTKDYVSVAVALKAAAAGGANPQALRVAGIEHLMMFQGTTSPQAYQFPCSGNLVVAAFVGGFGDDITSITDSNGNTWVDTAAFFNVAGDTGIHTYYAANATCSRNMMVTVHYNQTLGFGTGFIAGDNIFFYDVMGASSSPFRTGAKATGDQNTAGNISSVSIIPTASNSLIIAAEGEAFNAMNGLSGTGMLFDAINWGNQPYASGDATTYSDQNNGWGHYYNSGTSSTTFIWTEVDGSTPAGNWAARADEFK